MKKVAALLVFVAFLAACSKPPPAPQAAGKTERVATAAKSAADNSKPSSVFEKGVLVATPNFIAPEVVLSITPNPYNRCEHPDGKAVVTIQYDARPAGVKHTQLWFQRSNGKQVLWGQSPGTIPATESGKWANEGMKVLLVDVDNGNLLAVQTIHADDCK